MNGNILRGLRAAQHELVHIGAALNGQTETWLHEIGVQFATTPENLVLVGGVIIGVGYEGYHYLGN